MKKIFFNLLNLKKKKEIVSVKLIFEYLLYFNIILIKYQTIFEILIWYYCYRFLQKLKIFRLVTNKLKIFTK